MISKYRFGPMLAYWSWSLSSRALGQIYQHQNNDYFTMEKSWKTVALLIFLISHLNQINYELIIQKKFVFFLSLFLIRVLMQTKLAKMGQAIWAISFITFSIQNIIERLYEISTYEAIRIIRISLCLKFTNSLS